MRERLTVLVVSIGLIPLSPGENVCGEKCSECSPSDGVPVLTPR